MTGATAGIGHTFVRHLAADGHDLVLVARGQERLDEVAEEVRTVYGRKVETISADLTDRAALQRVADRVGDPERPIDLLVNNAGFGLGHSFTAGAVEEEERLLDIHCRAVLVLSHAAAMAMRERGTGAILNVSSVAGFAAMGTYSAVKAWETTFSEALARRARRRAASGSWRCAPASCAPSSTSAAGSTCPSLPEFGWLDVDDVVSRRARGPGPRSGRQCAEQRLPDRRRSLPGTRPGPWCARGPARSRAAAPAGWAHPIGSRPVTTSSPGPADPHHRLRDRARQGHPVQRQGGRLLRRPAPHHPGRRGRAAGR